MKIRKARIIWLFVAVVIVAAFGIPALVGDNSKSFTGEQREFARYALSESRNQGNPIQGSLELRRRVAWIKELTPADTGYNNVTDTVQQCAGVVIGGDETIIPMSKPYQARVTGYTFFGIPFTQRQILCNGSSWYIY